MLHIFHHRHAILWASRTRNFAREMQNRCRPLLDAKWQFIYLREALEGDLKKEVLVDTHTQKKSLILKISYSQVNHHVNPFEVIPRRKIAKTSSSDMMLLHEAFQYLLKRKALQVVVISYVCLKSALITSIIFYAATNATKLLKIQP